MKYQNGKNEKKMEKWKMVECVLCADTSSCLLGGNKQWNCWMPQVILNKNRS